MTSLVAMVIGEVAGITPTKLASLSGGCIGEVYRVELPAGNRLGVRTAVAKINPSNGSNLETEASMLQYLWEHSDLPVPAVYQATPHLLLMEWLPGNSRFSNPAQEHAAELLARLHQQTAPQFGLEWDTLIGGLHQPNPWTAGWLDFFREQRLLYMARLAYQEEKMPLTMLNRIERLCDRLDQWLLEPVRPALLHGDAWTTNILAENGRITGFIDPAIYYGHPEIELAFTTLFGTFGPAFFKRYDEINPIAKGFFEIRRDLYNLYPLLVHIRLFGGSYLTGIERTLRHIGF